HGGAHRARAAARRPARAGGRLRRARGAAAALGPAQVRRAPRAAHAAAAVLRGLRRPGADAGAAARLDGAVRAPEAARGGAPGRPRRHLHGARGAQRRGRGVPHGLPGRQQRARGVPGVLPRGRRQAGGHAVHRRGRRAAPAAHRGAHGDGDRGGHAPHERDHPPAAQLREGPRHGLRHLRGHRRADWDSAAKAAAETYAAVLATTLSRTFGALDRVVQPPLEPAVRLALPDLMVAAVAGEPAHLFNFTRVDLAGQHEYMAKTLDAVLDRALDAVDTLDAGARPPRRPLRDGQALFTLRVADWTEGRFSETDLWAPWAHTETGQRLARAVPGALATFTVLARMCIPPRLLSALWSALQPEANAAYDAAVTERLDAAAHVREAAALGAPAPGDLYAPVGTGMTFTVTGSPPSSATRVSAMDLAAAAVLVGAPLVIAMENLDVYSPGSGLTLAVTLCDLRDPALHRGVSTDLSSWGERLLALDDNPIENACLTPQLERLSALIAARPLAGTPACLVLVDSQLAVSRVLWAPPEPPRRVGFTLEDDPLLREIPFLETTEDQLPGMDPRDPLFTSIIMGDARVDPATAEELYGRP
ncbi:hypothetical protein EG861_13990, partial [Enterococcus faecalis]